MNSAVITGVISSIVTILFMYIDTKLFSEKRSKFVYFRNMLLNGMLVGSAVYLLGSPTLTSSVVQSGGSLTTISDLGESMIGGEATF